MTHPDELLAGYADGTLTDKERAAVDAHLSTCETCREELSLASRAIASLSALPEEPVPIGLTTRVVAEASRPSGRPQRTPWTVRLQWAAGLAAAAALVTVVALNLPNVTRSASESAPVAKLSGVPAVGDGVKATSTALVPVEVQKVDYDEAAVQELASSIAPMPAEAAQTPLSGTAQKLATAVQACVSRGTGGGLTANDSLARLIDASFHETPAYLAVYFESPGAGQPPAKVVVWIVAKSDCHILSYAFKRLAP